MNHGQGVVRAMLKDMQRQIDGRWASHLREHELHDVFHQREHDSTEVAIEKQERTTQQALERAQQVIDTRFEATNEWRGAFTDREREFLSKSEYSAQHSALMLRLDVLEDADIARRTREAERELTTARQREEDRARLTRLIAIVGVSASLGGFLLSLLAKLLGGP